jgi:hypothetical protein
MRRTGAFACGTVARDVSISGISRLGAGRAGIGGKNGGQ